MTRINLVPVQELSDQHLLAEYRELPRIVNSVCCGKVLLKDIPESYRLGKGHVKFFYNKILFLTERFRQICEELTYRGFALNPEFSYENLSEKLKTCGYNTEINYVFSQEEIKISRNRIIEKLEQKPLWYKWTKRRHPEYIKLNKKTLKI